MITIKTILMYFNCYSYDIWHIEKLLFYFNKWSIYYY